jgi:hypothetical protein
LDLAKEKLSSYRLRYEEEIYNTWLANLFMALELYHPIKGQPGEKRFEKAKENYLFFYSYLSSSELDIIRAASEMGISRWNPYEIQSLQKIRVWLRGEKKESKKTIIDRVEEILWKTQIKNHI